MLVMGIDPGVTTGIAVYDSEPADPLETCMSWEISSKHLGKGERDACFRIANVVESLASTVDAIVIESFVLRSSARQQDKTLLAPVRVTSRVLGILDERGVTTSDDESGEVTHIKGTPLDFQQPSLAKTTVKDAKLKKMGLWIVGEKHSRDAMKHAVTYVMRQYG